MGVLRSLICPVCKESVTVADVQVHMPRCCPVSVKEPNVPNIIAHQTLAVNSSAPTFSVLRIGLDSYLLTNYVPFRGGLNNCVRMFKHYQETMQSFGHREMFSLTEFVSTV